MFHVRRVGLKRALTNVIENAVKYAGNARITYEELPYRHSIHVDDDGPGIPEDKLGEAVKPFVRIESSRNKKTGGTGLGLSIAESILQNDGGKVTCINRQPHGFRVTLCLPK